MFVYVIFQQSNIHKEFKCFVHGIYKTESKAKDQCRRFNASRAVNIEFDECYDCNKYGHRIKDFSEYIYYYVEHIQIIE